MNPSKNSSQKLERIPLVPGAAPGLTPGSDSRQLTAGPFFVAVLCLAALVGLLAAPVRGQDENFSRDERGPIDLHKQKTLYVVPYAHLDTQWRWTYPQVIREFLANTLHQNFKLIDAYPNYVFNFSGSRRYEMMHEYYPEDWERLKGYIKAGRWFPCGSSVDEGDANVPGLESMVRHMLYGNHYFKREFGVTSEEFMLPDCFGFPASLPTIFVHCGIKGFSTQKLTWGSAVGIPFKVGNWIGPDGSALACALDPGSYGGGVKQDLSQDKSWLTRVDKDGALSGIFADYHYYGTGDRGGAPDESSVRWMEKSVAGNGPLRIVSATAQQMFLDLPPDARTRLPHYQGDLLLTQHSAGSLSSEAYMKRWNRKNELLADGAERAAVTAAWLGAAPYPGQKLYNAWDLMLGTQMHDMLPGTSLPLAYQYCWNDDVLVANQFGAVEEDSVGAVSAALDTQPHAGGVPLVVYNPLAIARDDITEGSIPGAEATAGVQVLGPDGKEVPSQVTSHDGGKVHFIFLANVPPLSFTTYEAHATAAPATPAASTALRVTNRTLENARYRVTVNEAGDIASIVDKAARRELLASPMRYEFQQENPSQFPAWNMDWSDAQKPPRGYVNGPASIRVVEDGPLRVALEIERQAEGSRFVSRVSLAAGGAGGSVVFNDKIDWGTTQACLKAAFPLSVSNPLAAYDDKVGAALRGNNDPKKYEVPQHEWLDLTDTSGAYGVSILNDCKFGSDKPDDHTVRLTLLYTPGVKGEYQDQATQDFGRQEMAYAVCGHLGTWQQGGTVAEGHRFNQPLRAFSAPAHPGPLGRSFALAAVDNPQVEIVAIKKAEDSDEIIVRLRELSGEAAQTAHLRFAAPIVAARAVDGQERPLAAAGPASLQQGLLAVQMAPYSLRAFALRLGVPALRLPAATAMPVALPFDEDVVSTRANHADGDFDHEGRTYPAEMLPPTIVSEGIPFKMGPTTDGQKNALACHGQTLELPAGDYDRVEFLAASHGDKTVAFAALGAGGAGVAHADAGISVNVQDWGAFLGQWDLRLWKAPQPELAYVWDDAFAGLIPGYVKPATVAWYASHRHSQEGIDFYQYCYLFKYGFELPKGAKSLVLPDAPDVRIFAVTLVKNSHADVQPAQPLFDTFPDHKADAAAGFAPAAGKYNDTVLVKVAEPLYRQPGGLRYTIDGSDPAPDSPEYTGPIALHASATLKTRMFLTSTPEGGPVGGPLAAAHYDVEDRTPPSVLSAAASTLMPQVSVLFSEPVDPASAQTPTNYRFAQMGVNVQAAHRTPDGMGVLLALNAPLNGGTNYQLIVNGVRDASPAGNMARQAVAVSLIQPAYVHPETFVCDGKNSRQIPVPGLPVGAHDPWTINFFVRTDREPENRTLIAGFGGTSDATGRARYLSKFANGIHFWSGSRDAESTTPLNLGTWQMLSASYDGKTVRLYKDATQIGEATIELEADTSEVNIAPLDPWDQKRRFQGKIAQMSIWKEALTPSALSILLKNMPAGSD